MAEPASELPAGLQFVASTPHSKGKERPRSILVVDIGGSHVKVLATGQRQPVEIPSGREFTPQQLVDGLRQATAGWKYNVVSIGYPGLVSRGHPVAEPPNLGKGWVEFDFRKALRKPVKLLNDAAMQALGSYRGGRMLFLGLGTGLGSTLILDGLLHSMELGDLPYRNGRSYAEFLGKAALKRMGPTNWSRHVERAAEQLKSALRADYVVLGGGQAKHVQRLPAGVLRGDNSKAFLGGFKLWQKGPPPIVSRGSAEVQGFSA